MRDFRAQYSDCGSFCFMHYPDQGMSILNSNGLKAKQAGIRLPAVWLDGTSYNGHIYTVRLSGDEASMVALFQRSDQLRINGLRRSGDYDHGISMAVAITACPRHLDLARFYLLPGKREDDLVRVLFLQRSETPEIKHLRVTWNQILAKLEEAVRAAELNLQKYFRKFDDSSETEDSDPESEEAAEAAEWEVESSDAESDEAVVSTDEDSRESYDTD